MCRNRVIHLPSNIQFLTMIYKYLTFRREILMPILFLKSQDFSGLTWTFKLPLSTHTSSFGGAEVACWPLIPKFAGSNPAEAVGFLRGDKNPQHAVLWKGSKIIGPMSQICGMQKNPGFISQAPFGHHFSPIVPPLVTRGLPRVVDARDSWRPE